jgi:hypothetical protein
MVQLHAFEHSASPRPTSDIDLPGDARAKPSITEHIGKTIDAPSLFGAILLMARALRVHSRPDDQREDLVLLLDESTVRRARLAPRLLTGITGAST